MIPEIMYSMSLRSVIKPRTSYSTVCKIFYIFLTKSVFIRFLYYKIVDPLLINLANKNRIQKKVEKILTNGIFVNIISTLIV